MSISKYLSMLGYETIEEWAEESGLTQQTDGTWMDDDGNMFDVVAYLASFLSTTNHLQELGQ